jgi:preprotein translocase subunit YajC
MHNEILAFMPPSGGSGGSNPLVSIGFFAVIIVVFYFMLIRPQQKRQKEMQNMLGNLKKGDRVITSSGIHGKILDVADKTFKLEIADNIQVTIEKAAVTGKID